MSADVLFQYTAGHGQGMLLCPGSSVFPRSLLRCVCLVLLVSNFELQFTVAQFGDLSVRISGEALA